MLRASQKASREGLAASCRPASYSDWQVAFAAQGLVHHVACGTPFEPKRANPHGYQAPLARFGGLARAGGLPFALSPLFVPGALWQLPGVLCGSLPGVLWQLPGVLCVAAHRVLRATASAIASFRPSPTSRPSPAPVKTQLTHAHVHIEERQEEREKGGGHAHAQNIHTKTCLPDGNPGGTKYPGCQLG